MTQRRPSPNFCDSNDDNSLAPRSFSAQTSLYHQASASGPTNPAVASGPTGEAVPYDEERLKSGYDDWNLRHPTQFSEVAADAFTDSTDAGIVRVSLEGNEARHVSNISQSGIVHLGPVVTGTTPPIFRTQSVGSSSESRGRSGLDSVSSAASSMRHGGSGQGQSSGLPSSTGSRPPSPTSAMESEGSLNTGTQASTSDSPQITFRYQHLEDENGHHLIVGREGTLTKCEDEVCVTASLLVALG